MPPTSALMLETQVRPDWKAIEQHTTRANRRLLRAIQVAVVLTSLVVLVARAVPGLAAWRPLLHGILATGILLGFPGWFVLSRVRPVRFARVLPLMTGLAALIATTAYLTAPAALRSGSWATSPSLPSWLGALVAAVLMVALAWVSRRSQAAVSPLGLGGPRIGWALGALVGASLGLHYWISLSAMRPIRPAGALSLADLAWVLFFLAGLRAVGEELLFRGMVYHLVTPDIRGLARPATRILLVNLFLYITPWLGADDPLLWVLGLLYGAAFALVATGLRHWLGWTAAPLAANAVFRLLITVAGAA